MGRFKEHVEAKAARKVAKNATPVEPGVFADKNGTHHAVATFNPPHPMRQFSVGAKKLDAVDDFGDEMVAFMDATGLTVEGFTIGRVKFIAEHLDAAAAALVEAKALALAANESSDS